MRIEVDVKLQLDVPDEETGEKYVDDMLEDMSVSTVLNLTHKIESTRVLK